METKFLSEWQSGLVYGPGTVFLGEESTYVLRKVPEPNIMVFKDT